MVIDDMSLRGKTDTRRTSLLRYESITRGRGCNTRGRGGNTRDAISREASVALVFSILSAVPGDGDAGAELL